MKLGGSVRLVMYGTVDSEEIGESDKTDKVPEIDECCLICEIGEIVSLQSLIRFVRPMRRASVLRSPGLLTDEIVEIEMVAILGTTEIV